MLRIATNRALSHIATQRTEKGTHPFFVVEQEKGCVSSCVPDPAPRPDEMAARPQSAERLAAMQQALNADPETGHE